MISHKSQTHIGGGGGGYFMVPPGLSPTGLPGSPRSFAFSLVIPREAEEYGLGETKYYVVLVASAIIWQVYFVGTVGVIFCSTSLLAGVITAVLLPATEILAVIFFHESFKAEKGIALFLSLWGFTSYFYTEFKESRKTKKQNSQLEQDSFSSPLNELAETP